MRHARSFGGIVLLLVVAGAGLARAEEVKGRWGAGGFIGYNHPMFTLADRFSSKVNKYGINISYVPSAKATIEVEYHRAKFDNGALVTKPFFWAPTKLNYVSANGAYDMKFSSLVMNGLVFLRKNRTMTQHSFAPYIAVGAGFYGYNATSKNILWPGQSLTDAVNAGGGKDAKGNQIPAYVMTPATDKQNALSATLGFGMESFITNSVAMDFRARYNFIIGELRPFDDWKLDKVFPIQLFDLSVGLKFYFWQ